MNAADLLRGSSDWESLVGKLAELGSSPEVRKLKGDTFELFTKHFLLTDPLYAAEFSDVFIHNELPAIILDQLKLPKPEIGVDLVAKTHGGRFWAIQCKFRQDLNENVTYRELGTFFSVTERRETFELLDNRLVFTSAYEVTSRVNKLHPEKIGYVTYSDLKAIDSERYQQIISSLNGDPIELKPYKPRPHQIKALSEIESYFRSEGLDRGKLIHPCGAGKSLTGYWISRILNSKSTLLAVPSLALVKQTLKAWTREALANKVPLKFIAVCSDQDVSASDDPAANISDLGISVTTNSSEISKFIKENSDSPTLVITTYQSGNAVIEATNEISHTFDLGIFDEAHKTVGHKKKTFSLLIEDKNVRIAKKVFMTATEKVFKNSATDFDINSMDDVDVYGEIIDQLSFKEALEQNPPILCDYKLITVAVSQAEIAALLRDNHFIRANGKSFTFEEDGTTLAAMLALRNLIAEKNIKHAISFHKSIKRSKEFMLINEQLNKENGDSCALSAFHVSGKDSTGRRKYIVDQFVSYEPSLVTNARCLTEGVDIPAVDAVIFADPKQSAVDIVQAAGRAMRLSPDKDLGYIVVPVILEKEEEDLSSNVFKQVINVIAALGINDERIIDESKLFIRENGRVSNGIVEFINLCPDIDINFDNLVRNLRIKIWDRLSFAKTIVGQTGFEKWMLHRTELSVASNKKYSNAVRKISNDLVKLNITFGSLEDIILHADLQELKSKYFEIPEYRELDKRGNQMYSAAFGRLIEYQKFMLSNKVDQATSE